MKVCSHPEHGTFGALSLAEANLLLFSIDHVHERAEWIIEIGTFQGLTAAFMARYCRSQGYMNRILSVDPNPCIVLSDDERNEFGDRLNFLCGTSKDVDPSIKPAMVLVDGCHCLECCMIDIEIWRKRVVVGGLLIFHDVYHEGKMQKGSHDNAKFAVRAAIENANLEEYSRLCMSDDPKPNMWAYTRIK